MDKKMLHMAAYMVLWVGGINWGLVGLFNYNIVEMVFSFAPGLDKIIYILVGVATVYIIATHKMYCKYCGGK